MIRQSAMVSYESAIEILSSIAAPAKAEAKAMQMWRRGGRGGSRVSLVHVGSRDSCERNAEVVGMRQRWQQGLTCSHWLQRQLYEECGGGRDEAEVAEIRQKWQHSLTCTRLT